LHQNFSLAVDKMVETDSVTQHEEIERVQTSFRVKVANLQVSPQTIVLLLQFAMEAVEASMLHGLEKKNAVVLLVRKLVMDAPMDDSIETLLLEMIDDGIMGHIIDITVAASKGKLHLNASLEAGKIAAVNLAPSVASCVTDCLPCWKG